MEQTCDVRQLRKSITIYHWFPSLIVVVLVGLFFLTFLVSTRYWISALIACVPSALLLWRWSVAGTLIDRSGCPRCGKSWKGTLTWTYPPAKCPHCGASIKDLLNGSTG